jgi:CRISPR-associated protein Csb1
MTALPESFLKTDRILLEAHLCPAQGARFQPTGFADLGAATYELPDGTRMLLVESAQSMANRLERICLQEDGVTLAKELEGLPWVRVTLTGDSSAVTSSLAEAHRLNSPFILKADGGAFEECFAERTQYAEGHAVDWAKVARGVLALDPCSLVHGLFMSNFADGRVRLTRALTGFIEAKDVREVASGGVKNSPIDPAGTLRVSGYDKNVYSNVPYARTEYVAKEITAFFNIDVALLRGYRLGDAATSLLVSLALWKVRRLLDAAMRLRTACELQLQSPDALNVQRPTGAALPTSDELLEVVQGAIKTCRKAELFAEPAVTELSATTKRKSKDDRQDKGDDESADGES